MRYITLILILFSINCTAQTVSSTITVEHHTIIDTVVKVPFIYKSETFFIGDGKYKTPQEQIYTTIYNGSIVTVSENLLNETIRILNIRKLKGEDVDNELIINTERLKKIKLLNK